MKTIIILLLSIVVVVPAMAIDPLPMHSGLRAVEPTGPIDPLSRLLNSVYRVKRARSNTTSLALPNRPKPRQDAKDVLIAFCKQISEDKELISQVNACLSLTNGADSIDKKHIQYNNCLILALTKSTDLEKTLDDFSKGNLSEEQRKDPRIAAAYVIARDPTGWRQYFTPDYLKNDAMTILRDPVKTEEQKASEKIIESCPQSFWNGQ